jgi:hypothetical protein
MASDEGSKFLSYSYKISRSFRVKRRSTNCHGFIVIRKLLMLCFVLESQLKFCGGNLARLRDARPRFSRLAIVMSLADEANTRRVLISFTLREPQ